jgi:5'-methylthioinosine phosphorylase
VSDTLALAVIGGSGLYALPGFEPQESFTATTKWGDASGPVRIGMLYGRRVAFLARHGEGHSLPPHRVNYRANLAQLHELHPERVLAINTVGGITPRCHPTALVVPDQIIDYTNGRASSYWDGEGEMQHAEFGEPYSSEFRFELLAAGERAGIELVNGACYGATQGPRFETRAEISRMQRDGCDLVGMTGMPEAALARELGIPYASLCIVANWAAGCDPAVSNHEPHEITMQEVLDNVAVATARIPRLLEALLTSQ